VLEEAMATIKTQQATIYTLCNTKKQLVDTIAEMKKGGGRGNRSPRNRDLRRRRRTRRTEQFAKCVICTGKEILL
jgi:hypothetical protein